TGDSDDQPRGISDPRTTAPAGPLVGQERSCAKSSAVTCRRKRASYTLYVRATCGQPLLRSASSNSAERVMDTIGAWPSGKARDFGSRIRRFESFRPSQIRRWAGLDSDG